MYIKAIRYCSISECTMTSKGILQNVAWQKLLIVTSNDFFPLSVCHCYVRRQILLFIISDMHGYRIMIYLGCNPLFRSIQRHLSDMHCLHLLSNVTCSQLSIYICQYKTVNNSVSLNCQCFKSYILLCDLSCYLCWCDSLNFSRFTLK